MTIKRLPSVLALHLKRFKYMERLGRFKKLSYKVAFPLELELDNVPSDTADAERRCASPPLDRTTIVATIAPRAAAR